MELGLKPALALGHTHPCDAIALHCGDFLHSSAFLHCGAFLDCDAILHCGAFL